MDISAPTALLPREVRAIAGDEWSVRGWWGEGTLSSTVLRGGRYMVFIGRVHIDRGFGISPKGKDGVQEPI